RRGLHDRAARPQEAVALGGVDHGDRRTVLRRAARVGELHLEGDGAGNITPQARKLHDGRVADEVEHRLGHVRRRRRWRRPALLGHTARLSLPVLLRFTPSQPPLVWFTWRETHGWITRPGWPGCPP